MNSRKNQKGFTMVELLTTIVILSILMIGAIVGIRVILDNAKKNYYSSQNKTMVLAGQSYVQENRNALPKTLGRSSKIPLKKLKDQNYIKEVVDYNKKSCDLDKSYIKIYKYSEKDYSYMAYMVCPSYTSKEESYANGPTIEIDFKSAYDVAKADVTMSDPDKVISYSYIVYKDGVEVKNSGTVNAGLQKEVKKSISLKQYVPGEIKISVVATDIYGNVSKKTVSEKIKDTIPPTCGAITGASTTWTKENRKITVLCSDTGSGCERDDYTKTFKTTTKVGTISIKDKAGNARDCSVNAYVDKTAPSCTSSGGNSTWTNGNRTLTGTCSDSHSGCKGNATNTISSNTNTTTASPGTVYDNVGNSAVCPSNQTVKIDKTAPTCSSSGGNASWTNGSRTLTGTCSDTGGSGCKGNVTKPFTSNTNTTAASPGTVSDNAGNSVTCPANQTVKIDKTAPTCSSSGGNTAWTNGSRTLTGTCSDTGGSGCKGNATNTINSSMNTTTASPGTVYDNAGNSAACPTNQTVRIDKTAPTCSSSGGNAAWTNGSRTLTGTCSDTGGSGCKGNASYFINWDGNWTNLSPGTVYDNAGNSVACPANQTVRVDKTAPTCTSSGGSSAWTSTSRTLIGTCSDSLSGCKGNVSYFINWEGNWTNLSPGTVYDNAGNGTTCPANQTVRISKKPATPSIYNPTGGNWVNYNFSLTVSSSGPEIAYWQYSYDNATWNTYANSATGNFVTTPYSAERNQPSYIRACNSQNYCSDSASTWIRIDKHAPYYTSVGAYCGDYWGNGSRGYVRLYFRDDLSGLGYRFANSWDQVANYVNEGNFGGITATDDVLASGNSWIGFSHQVCDLAGNCTRWDDGQVYYPC